MTDKIFTINFGKGICGLEILLDPRGKFNVGNQFYSEIAKQAASVLPQAEILSLNGQSTANLKTMLNIQAMFKEAAQSMKKVKFYKKFDDSTLEKLKNLASGTMKGVLEIEDGISGIPYAVQLQRRPLGFTVAASPSGQYVEVCQVDSVHEEDIKLGSRIMAVNGVQINGVQGALKELLTCKMPCTLSLMQMSEIFLNDEKEETVDEPVQSFTFSSHDVKNEVKIEVKWFDKAAQKQDPRRVDFTLPVGPEAPLAMVRAKIAILSGLKFTALRLIHDAKLLKTDSMKIKEVFSGSNKSLFVVVSERTQAEADEERKEEIDYKVHMGMIGAFLKECDPSVYAYLWDDIDHEKKGLLHITELDRLLARVMGVYERNMCVRPKMEYTHESVNFKTDKNLGLVIEGNEVIMCHKGSQAETEGILPGWKVVGADYLNKNKERVRFPVDHKSCLQSLKRAKTECEKEAGFKVLCLRPMGARWETQMIMKKQAIGDLKLNDGSQTLKKKHYGQLPGVFAPRMYRVTIETKPVNNKIGLEIKSGPDSSKPGVYVQSKSANPAFADVTAGDRIMAIGAESVEKLRYDDFIKIWGKTFPMVVTLEAQKDLGWKNPFE